MFFDFDGAQPRLFKMEPAIQEQEVGYYSYLHTCFLNATLLIGSRLKILFYSKKSKVQISLFSDFSDNRFLNNEILNI